MEDNKSPDESSQLSRLAMLRLGSTTGNAHDYEVPVIFSDPCSMCGTMKRRSSPSLQNPTTENEPRNKKILIDPTSVYNPTNTAGAPSLVPSINNGSTPTVTPPVVRSNSEPITASPPVCPFTFSVPTTTPGSSFPASLRRCNSAPDNNKSNKSGINTTMAPPQVPLGNSYERVSSFSGSCNTPMASPYTATFPLRRPCIPRPVPVQSPPAAQTAPAKGDKIAMAEPKDTIESSDLGQIVSCVALPATSGESAVLKRLKRMKGRLAELNKWLNEVMREAEEEGVASEDNEVDFARTDDGEEAVMIEGEGEGFGVNYECSCGRHCHVNLIL